ncbi:hypothetical protein J3E73DRAFT_371925 [Bipolaris maydis]|nr:hypothetical protein J3E73DRAFT_371925 [Bipolaris maydis]
MATALESLYQRGGQRGSDDLRGERNCEKTVLLEKNTVVWMSLRSGRVREMAISTPERDRDHEATSLPTELPAPLKRRARNTEQNEHYRRRPLQLDLLADDSDTIQIDSSQPVR